MQETRTQNSAISAWLNSTVIGGMPSDLQGAIKTVKKDTYYRSGQSTPTLQTSSTRLFLFSEYELAGSVKESHGVEGSHYEKFTSNSSRTKRMNNGSGSTNIWWTRSPAESGYHCSVNGAGVLGKYYDTGAVGICFGFCV